MKKTKYSKWQLYWQLFYVFLKISFFGFGGGNAVMPLIKNEVVVKKRWITEDKFNH
ncbi:chromate transporter [Spiroplasma endosymbiont of Asaphidion curtum]|uniref:chromate transporter n=1 Tax=Spiroplasma endosymbiont of Asaphidion curtum TaxID=3066281 RepID=UPI00313EC616